MQIDISKAAIFRETLAARVDSNKEAAARSPQCADWSNGVAAGYRGALLLFVELFGEGFTACGGCGASHPDQRCIGCRHDFCPGMEGGKA